MKTLDEIRAEKLAKSQGPKDCPTTVDGDVMNSLTSTKRPAPQNKKQIRIKRPKIASDPGSDVQVPTSVIENTVTNPAASSKPPVNSQPDSTETDDYLNDEIDDGGDASTGLLNEDELLLEIDNILGD